MCISLCVCLQCDLCLTTNPPSSPPQDVLTELQIPYHTVGASRKVEVVQYSLGKALLCYTRDRQGLLSKCTAINADMAKRLLDHGYKQLSTFKRWCPVKVWLLVKQLCIELV